MNHWTDRLGMTVSGLCGVHCMGLVALSLLQPILNISSQHWHFLEPLEWTMASLAIVFAILGFGGGFRHHGHKGPVLLGGSGLALIWLGLLGPWHEQSLAVLFPLIGGTFLIFGHRWNIRCKCSHLPKTST